MLNILNTNKLINYILQEIKRHEHAILLHTGSYKVPYPTHFEVLSGWNSLDLLEIEENSTLDQIDEFKEKHQGKWIFIHIAYDLKNSIEKRLTSEHQDPIEFPLMTLFVPEFVGIIKGGKSKLVQQHLTKNTITEIPIPETTLIENVNVKTAKTILTFQDDFIFEEKYTAAINQIHHHCLIHTQVQMLQMIFGKLQ